VAGAAIAIELLSIIAANWDTIPERVKIGIDFTLVAPLSRAVACRERLGASWLRESDLSVVRAHARVDRAGRSSRSAQGQRWFRRGGT